MNYELYDILTIEDKEYLIASTVLKDKEQYFLLVETNEEEELKLNNIKIMKQSTVNNLEPDMLYPVIEEEEMKMSKSLLLEAMDEDLKDD